MSTNAKLVITDGANVMNGLGYNRKVVIHDETFKAPQQNLHYQGQYGRKKRNNYYISVNTNRIEGETPEIIP